MKDVECKHNFLCGIACAKIKKKENKDNYISEAV